MSQRQHRLEWLRAEALLMQSDGVRQLDHFDDKVIHLAGQRLDFLQLLGVVLRFHQRRSSDDWWTW